MPANVHKIVFPVTSGRLVASVPPKSANAIENRKIVSLPPKTIRPFAQRRLPPLPSCKRLEGSAAFAVALVLHLGLLAVSSHGGYQETVTPPTPIQIDLIVSPQPKTPGPRPKAQQKPASDIKRKTKQIKRTKPKTEKVITTQAPTAKTAATQNPDKPKLETTPNSSATSAAPAAAKETADSRAKSEQPLVLPKFNADYLDNPAPVYPEPARARGEQGKVWVRALITSDGRVAQLMVRKSSGYASLDQSAVDTVKDWRFIPARRGDTVVAAWVVIPISFALEG